MCAMLLQEYDSKIAVLDLRLKEEQKGKAAAAEVSASQAALLPAGTASHDHGPCRHTKYAYIIIVITTREISHKYSAFWALLCCLRCGVKDQASR